MESYEKQNTRNQPIRWPQKALLTRLGSAGLSNQSLACLLRYLSSNDWGDTDSLRLQTHKKMNQ